MGTTIGAGVYALIGEIAKTAGYLAPWSFGLAALLALLTAISFAELSSRYPRTAGIAFYVETGFRMPSLAKTTGILAIAAGLVSCGALLNGFVGYLQEFLPLSRNYIIPGMCIAVCLVACWGIRQSIWVAGCITLIEVGGLFWATTLATNKALSSPVDLSIFLPTQNWSMATMVLSGAVLAFYAYIGFEDMVEVAEEVVDPKNNLPRAIFITLAGSTLLYMALTVSALLATGPEYLAASSAPLADLFRAVGSTHPGAITVIGLLAIINGVLIQVVMASRILYGLASRNQMPKFFARLHRQKQTPVNATVVASLIVLIVAWFGRIGNLAELTSVIILVIFALVNSSLYLIESRKPLDDRRNGLRLSATLGAVTCVGLLFYTVFSWLNQ
ncbi:MAG: APA family basic amino acid/polyamine antiporter [Limisphaerales bacterium]|jgi:APA family basic amino acid/polyamine antiporter